MRSYHEVYDLYLHLQAEISFGLETTMFNFPDFSAAETILDIGCGNASYASLLASRFPSKHIVGVDPDADLLAAANQRAMPSNLTLIEGYADDLTDSMNPDVLICRLVTMYMSDPREVATWASRRTLRHAIVIDAADDLFSVYPALPLFAQTEEANATRIAKMGGSRESVHQTPKIWSEAGFNLQREHDILVQSSMPNARYAMHHMIRLHAELAVGWPLDSDLVEEVFSWSLHPQAFLQYGLRARHFSLL